MTLEIKIPSVGENIESGTVTSINVKVGDKVEKDDILLELETGKAVVEIPAENSGTVKEIKIEEGAEVDIGAVVMILDADETAGEDGQKRGAAAEQKRDEVAQTSAAQTRDAAAQTRPEGAQTSVEDGRKREPGEQKRDEAAETAPGQKRDEAAQTVAGQKRGEAAQTSEAHSQPQPSLLIPAAPSVRRFAREIGIDIGDVTGSGPGGRISVDDVKAYAKKKNTEVAKPDIHSFVASEPLPDFSKWGDIRREKMSGIRKVTAQHLSYSWSTIPHVTQFDKADITELEALRKKLSPEVAAKGGKLTMTAILAGITAKALLEFPVFNTSIDIQSQEVIYKDFINMGIAVDTPNGLLVPVIRNVQEKGIAQIAVEMQTLAEKARERKISPADLEGGTFTISNLGGITGTGFTPIVNSPEVAILGVSRGAMEPVWNGEEFEPRLMLPISLSYDHRIIDGADGARFVRWLKEALEQPFRILL